MNFNNYSTWTFRNMLKLCLITVCVFFNSCQKDQPTIPLNIASINFITDAYTVEKNNTEPLTISLSLSLPLEQEATVVINLGANTTALSNQFITNPSATDGKITLHLPKDAVEASFTVTSVNNFADNVAIEFVIESATGGIKLAKDKQSTLVTLKGNNPTTPELTTSVNTLEDFGVVNIGEASASKSYAVSTRNLTQDVTVTASNNFKVSLDNSVFTSAIQIPFIDSNNSSVTVYVRFEPLTGFNTVINGTIAHSSSQIETSYIALSGQEGGNASSTFFLNDDFNYGNTGGDLRTVSPWVLQNASTTRPVLYVPTGLTLPNYPNNGGAVTVNNGSNCNVMRTFDSQSSGIVYTSITVNISASPAASVFFFSHILGGTYYNRLYAKDEANTLKLGIARAGTVVEYSPKTLNYGTTYIAVIKYNFSTKESSLYIVDGGAFTVTEPATADAVSVADAAPATLDAVLIRQSSGTFNATLDGVRVSTSWRGAIGL